jgi:hypothetical protein
MSFTSSVENVKVNGNFLVKVKVTGFSNTEEALGFEPSAIFTRRCVCRLMVQLIQKLGGSRYAVRR